MDQVGVSEYVKVSVASSRTARPSWVGPILSRRNPEIPADTILAETLVENTATSVQNPHIVETANTTDVQSQPCGVPHTGFPWARCDSRTPGTSV
mmetsp:Transcript_27038/g.71122  ORF Transcript_27038/g.71122 Transcript_27038/m.71122 type:complete len:95 (+) Transcript_27038:413-697(+)